MDMTEHFVRCCKKEIGVAIETLGIRVAATFAFPIGVLALLLLGVTPPAHGAPGGLDASFGTGGKVTTDFSGEGGEDGAFAMAIQPDGKIVTAGYSSKGFMDFALARYNADGTLDASFGTGGKVTTDFAGRYDIAFAVAIQPDGKIVAAGSSGTGNSADFALARYNADGTLDASFGTGGKVTTDFAGNEDGAHALAIQPDGKIVAAGSAAMGISYDFALARYNADGTLDTSFGTGGKVATDFAGRNDGASALAIQPDGKIVAAGSTFERGLDFGDFALTRYNADGTLDASFGTGGKVTTDFAGNDDEAFALAIQPDGKVVAAGGSFTGPNREGTRDFALARYNADGTLDASFGTGGKVTTDFAGSDDVALALAIQPDGKGVAAGLAFTGRNLDFALARYSANGTLDAGFGTGGKVTTDFAGSEDVAYAVAIQPDSKIVAAGLSVKDKVDFALARYEGGSVLEVAIDIKPGSFPNSINPKSKGKIPVAILTTDTFDATTVDPTTVRFGAKGTEAAPVQHALEDVNGDGRADMILHFNIRDTGIQCGDTSATLTGKTFSGQEIQGTDSIKTVGCNKAGSKKTGLRNETRQNVNILEGCTPPQCGSDRRRSCERGRIHLTRQAPLMGQAVALWATCYGGAPDSAQQGALDADQFSPASSEGSQREQ